MKISKKFVIYALALLVIVIFLFSGNYIFNVLIKTDREARLANITLPSETQNIKFNIDEVKKVDLKWKDALEIKGWVYKTIGTYAKRNVYLALKSDKSTFIFKVENENTVSRPDVSAYFHIEGGINSHGFDLFIPLYMLKEPAYKIGFVIEDETGKYYSTSNKVLRFSGESAFISNEGTDPATLSYQVPLKIKESTKEAVCYFDTAGISGKYVTIRGWGFLKGMDAISIQSYILMKKNETVKAFEVKVKIRKDVSGFFKKSGLNLDSSGFQSLIPIEILEKGDYQIGFYIVKGDQAGTVFTKKHVIIEK